MEIDREKALADVVKTIEDEYIALEKKAAQLGLNQPVVVAISSTSADIEPPTQDWNNQVGYSRFNVKFPFPALKVKSLQLLSANIPQANANIPNTACAFWYYRLNGYSGITPNSENLYYIRLLPSYYKQELLNTPEKYGYNQTFKNYPSLNTALNLSCANDPAYDNYIATNNIIVFQEAKIPFLPNEIGFNYNMTTNRFSMTGTNATTQYCYKEYSFDAVAYGIGDVVFEGIKVYKSLQNGNIGHLLTETDYWEQIYIPIVQEWDANTIYNADALVRYDGDLYQASVKNTNQSPTGVYTYSETYQYCQFQVVEYEGTLYTYIYPEQFNTFPTNTAFWTPTLYTNDQAYPAGFIASYDGSFYRALRPSMNVIPVDGDDWEEIGNFWNFGAPTISNRYLITGPADPNVALRQGTAKRQYTPYHLYETGEYVFHKGVKYTSIRQTKGSTPFQTTSATPYNNTFQYAVDDVVVSQGLFYIAVAIPPVGAYPSRLSNFWSLQSWAANQIGQVPIVSLSSISQKFDFYDPDLIVQGTFPVGIPPQPFNQTPKRLLNTILGFTFTGRFNPETYSNISQGAVGDLVPSSTLNDYNRLRPIPSYYVEVQPALLTDHPSYTTQTYTADGFCNLVYSSILRIYCNLIFAGTLDSNLLGIIPFNCGNLGITFANNYIDNHITKIQDEIYEMRVWFEDEYGEPYILTNNAVSTLMLKLTYKENPDI